MTDQLTAELARDIGKARGTDYFLMKDELSEDEKELLYTTRAFGETEIQPIINDYWERGEFPFEIIPKIAKLNIIGDWNMTDHGCRPMTAVGCGLIVAELARNDTSIQTFVGVHMGLAMQSINMLGSEEQRAQYLPEMARLEKIGAFALTEPDHGSDSVSMEATAERQGNDWIINGHKRWPGNATWCDYIIVFARDVEDKQIKGFIVEKDNPGFQATKIEKKVSLRCVQNADIVLDNCRVSEDARLPKCRSFMDVAKVLAGTRNGVAWAAVGNATAAYDIALTYAERRVQFGKPIASNQMIQRILVEMLGDLTAMQLYALRLGRLIDEGKMTDTQASLAKYYCTVKARDVCRKARDVLGGNGITLDFHIMRHLCDMEALITYEGTVEMQSLIVGRHLTGQSAFV